jgi:hypothetical protein
MTNKSIQRIPRKIYRRYTRRCILEEKMGKIYGGFERRE